MKKIEKWSLTPTELQRVKLVANISCIGVNCNECPLMPRDTCIRALANIIVAKQEDEK